MNAPISLTLDQQPAIELRLRQPLLRIVERGAKLIGLWLRRARQRRQLARLDAHQLRDIGISAAQAAEVARKPFWQA